MDSELCFGVSKRHKGRCDILENGRGMQKCKGYGKYSEGIKLKICSFYKTNEEFLREAEKWKNL